MLETDMKGIMTRIERTLVACENDCGGFPDSLIINFKEDVMRDFTSDETMISRGFRRDGQNWIKPDGSKLKTLCLNNPSGFWFGNA